MRLLDEDREVSVQNLSMLLEKSEAIQLIGYLELLVREGGERDHYHLDSSDFSKEVTLALYDSNDVSHFSERYKLLIREDR